MSTIRILPDQVANRIAAGEVVERPVAVVKELVDNSIDAGAMRVKIEIQKGGKSLILVEDDGKGMTPDDALLCIERHATSKISSSEDLFNIKTLGFRGEAIPSIASVSRFLMRTRTEDHPDGTEILINGGKLLHRKDVGTPKGTRIEVSHLFSSMPARRKFMKTDSTEASHIIQWMRLIALAYPHIAFRLQSQQRTLMQLPENQELKNRILQLWGQEFDNQLLPVELESDEIKISGYIGKPGVSRPSRNDMVMIVNGRPVESRTLGFAMTEAYHTHIPKGRYPIGFLRVEVEPSSIDVNIHPSKKEIKFKQETKIRSLVIQGIWDIIRPQRSVEPVETTPLPSPTIKRDPPSPQPTNLPRETANFTIPRRDVTSPPQNSLKNVPEVIVEKREVTKTPDEQVAKPKISRTQIEREWRFIGSFSRTYSLFERSAGLTAMHAQRALNRIRYEEILNQFQNRKSLVQSQIVPIPFELDVHQTQRMPELVDTLRECQIEVETFGRNYYRIETTPHFLSGEQAQQLIIDELKQETLTPLQNLQKKLAQTAASQSAQRIELPLIKETATDLLMQLLECEQPAVDPSGNSVITHFPHRMFE
ncbi:MAG: DNA mismatch repair endonuclease MutL [Opitutales bacterium]|nr:DNA mismatch repair endonuclease MutL [Opitutales bacterium]